MKKPKNCLLSDTDYESDDGTFITVNVPLVDGEKSVLIKEPCSRCPKNLNCKVQDFYDLVRIYGITPLK
jgi:hypothetical protein